MPERNVLMLSVASSLFGALVVAVMLQGATAFVRSLADLSAADRMALERAQIEVLETMKQGAVSAWKDAKTGHSGEAKLVRRYEQKGMMCGEVEHYLKLQRESRYVMPMCRVSDGTWRLAY